MRHSCTRRRSAYNVESLHLHNPISTPYVSIDKDLEETIGALRKREKQFDPKPSGRKSQMQKELLAVIPQNPQKFNEGQVNAIY